MNVQFDPARINAAVANQPHGQHPMIVELIEAAGRFEKRKDSFAQGKADICYDLAGKLRRYHDFASGAQAEFARKLVEWSKPRVQADHTKPGDWGRPVPKLFAVMQKHAVLHVDPLKLSRRNQDTLVWVMYEGACVGKIENERAVAWTRKCEAAGTTALHVLGLIEEFETDPLAAAKKYGKLSGRCCSCGRDLTDPVSIENGIGPICATKFR